MTTLGTLKDEVKAMLGGRTDTDSDTAAERGINAGIQAAALLFEPPEAKVEGNLTCINSADHVTISTYLQRVVRIDGVYNSTASAPVFRIPYRMRRLLWLPTSGNVQFYSTWGKYFYYNPTPTSNQVMLVNYLQLPARLTEDANVFPFAQHEDFCLAFGTAIAWAAQEENENVDMWAAIRNAVGLTEQQITLLKQYIREEKDIDYYLRGALQEGTTES